MPEHFLPVDPRVSKGVISQFLRTNCRRQLYLSIYAPLHAHPKLQAVDFHAKLSRDFHPKLSHPVAG